MATREQRCTRRRRAAVDMAAGRKRETLEERKEMSALVSSRLFTAGTVPSRLALEAPRCNASRRAGSACERRTRRA
eukprot:scaffold1292_cov64-Phaeocystis_antarctica.AAC.2